MSKEVPSGETLQRALRRDRPNLFLAVLGLLAVLACGLGGGWVVHRLLEGRGPAVQQAWPRVQDGALRPDAGRADLLWIGAGAFLGLVAGVLVYAWLMRMLGFNRRSSEGLPRRERPVESETQRQALAHQRQQDMERWHTSAGDPSVEEPTASEQGDEELLPSNRHGGDVKYTEADFPCPPSMPGKKGSAGSLFCDWVRKAGEVAFAVVRPDPDASPRELEAVGERLQAWQTSNSQVRRILGLEELLRGRRPALRADMFGLEDANSTVPVALVYVTPQADHEGTGQELLAILEGLNVEVYSPGYYSALRS